MEDSQIRVVKKALDALDILVEASLENRGVSLGDIAEKMAVQPTTIRNILKTMEQCGYVSRLEGRLYAPGCKCQGMARSSVFTGENSEYIANAMHVLAQTTGESVVLTTLFAGNRCVITRVESGEIIRVDSKSADMTPFWSLVTSRVLVAYASDDEIEMTLQKHGIPGPGWIQAADKNSLMKLLSEIRRNGFAEDNPTPDSYSLAVPVIYKTGSLLACIGLYMPLFRLSDGKKDSYLNAMKHTASYISQIAG